MTRNITHQELADHAAQLFMQGYNCGQAVFVTFAQRYGLSHDDAMRLSAALGGGLGRQRLTCGAVTAMALVAGQELGNTRPGDTERQNACFAATREMTEAFKQQYGSAICGEILGLKGYAKADGPAHHQPIPEQYRGRPCALKVKLAAAILAQRFPHDDTK